MITTQEISDIVRFQRVFFNSSATHAYDFRIDALHKLKQGIQKFEGRLRTALEIDLGKSEFEAYATEIGLILHELRTTRRSLKKWMKPRRVKTSFLCQPSTSQVLFTPLGVNLIISPFNYPVSLTFIPLIAAIAAGNTAVIKTSELTPSCSREIQNLIEETFEPEFVAYIPGKVPETTTLLTQKFDHIFFTGSPKIGAIIMQAAAKHLTPVTGHPGIGWQEPVHCPFKCQHEYCGQSHRLREIYQCGSNLYRSRLCHGSSPHQGRISNKDQTAYHPYLWP
jgi:aldehyde dehydrogenase (NAD+)